MVPRRILCALVLMLCAAAGAADDPAGQWLTKQLIFETGAATAARLYVSVNAGATGSVRIDNVRGRGLRIPNGSFEDGLWHEGGRWGIWQLDTTEASAGAQSARALYTPANAANMARMWTEIEVAPETQYTLEFDVLTGVDFAGQLGCSVFLRDGDEYAAAASAGVQRSQTAAAPSRYPKPGRERRWRTLVPNGMLDTLNSGHSGVASWTSTVTRGHAEWAIAGVDGTDRCLALDLEIGGTGTWLSEPFPLAPGTDYAVSALFRSENEDAPHIARIIVRDVDSDEVLWQRTLPAYARWERVRDTFWNQDSTQVRIELVGAAGQTLRFDEIMLLGARTAVHPQTPEDGAVLRESRPFLRWWHEDGDAGRYVVLLARDPSLAQDQRRTVSSGLEIQVPVPLEPGVWFWTVLPASAEPVNEVVQRSLSEVRSFTVAPDRGAAADTTPPHLYRCRPALDSTSAATAPLLSLSWLERGGAGIDPDSLRIRLDGEPCPGAPVLSAAACELRLPELAAGRHRVHVEIADRAGNRAEAAWQFYVGESPPSRAVLDENGWILFNDLPFFPVFHYNYQMREMNMERDADFADAGFNLIVNCFDFERALAWGLKGMQSTGGNPDRKNAAELAEQYRQGLTRFRGGLDHPAYLGMWMDEAWKPEHTWPVFRAFRGLKEDHLMLPVGSGPWQIAQHPIQLVDVLSLDHYPVPVHAFADIVDIFRILAKIRLPGQGMHYWAQAFDWKVFVTNREVLSRFDYKTHFLEDPKLAGHDYRPTPREQFAMTALGWVCGAQNAGWWGPGAQKFPAVRAGLLECGRRASWLGPILRAAPPTQPAHVRAECAHRVGLGISHPLVHILEREYGGRRHLIAVNVNRTPVRARFQVPGLTAENGVRVLWEDRVLAADNGVFADVIPGPGAVVYQY